MTRTFYEFFAGGGMARAGLGEGWTCLFANDFDPRKGAAYAANWGGERLHIGDVAEVAAFELPGEADLAWASFPCQDLSLAGNGAGLKGERSGAFWPFWRLIQQLRRERRAPRTIVLENVCGLLTSHGGADFVELCRALERERYRFGAVVIDAVRFVPQSRPRLFIVAVRDDLRIPEGLVAGHPSSAWHPPRLRETYAKLPDPLPERWLWLSLPEPPRRNTRLADLIDDEPEGVVWHGPEQTERLLSMMSDGNRAKVDAAAAWGGRVVGAIYKRTRVENGVKFQRAEVRFDDVAGCLRTPAGGSSRQEIMVIDDGRVRTRLVSARETARLMGMPDEYRLPQRYNEAYHLTGDGVAVPVVRFLAENFLEPLLTSGVGRSKLAAVA
jgi:DNA (cytosine-5)-methyltransferase 1